MASVRSMGYIPDTYDARDHSLFTLEHAEEAHQISRQAASAPQKPVILSPLPPVYDQKHIGSCVANVVAAALRYAFQVKNYATYDTFDPSRLFLYYLGRTHTASGRDLENTPKWLAEHDKGSSPRDTISALAMVGVCPESLWPYGDHTKVKEPGSKVPVFVTKDDNGNKITPNPVWPVDEGQTTSIFTAARDSIPRGISYYRIMDPNAKVNTTGSGTPAPLVWDVLTTPAIPLLEKCLRDGYPFIFAVQLYMTAGLNDEYHDDPDTGESYPPDIGYEGIFVMPPPENTKKDGQHAMLAVGFDQARRLFLVQNSWGTLWPFNVPPAERNGRFWMPYEWFEQGRCSDFWVIKSSGEKFNPKSVKYNPAHWAYPSLT